MTLTSSTTREELTIHEGGYNDLDSICSPNEEFIRAEREDDDGYDPYSDRVTVDPLFEEDPWR